MVEACHVWKTYDILFLGPSWEQVYSETGWNALCRWLYDIVSVYDVDIADNVLNMFGYEDTKST
jgi:hypothetical protein